VSYVERIDRPGPKKLLALDGGGIRGVLTLELLARIEELVRGERNAPDLVLGDYFDYVAGTSTGAIIAAGIACGMTVGRLKDLYRDHGAEMFDRKWLMRWRSKYNVAPLRAMLQEALGPDTTLGDERLHTLLMMVLRNATTDSPWPLCNNPGAKYNDRRRRDCNLNLPLWQLVRGSTAAPTFFDAESVVVGREFVFVDGGVTVHNNPAFQLFMMATHPAYRLGWPTGEDQLLLISVGTGMADHENDRLRAKEMNLLFNASSIPAALMSAAANEQDALCRVFGRCRFGAEIDREIGDLRGDDGLLPERLFTYVRYNADLSANGLLQLGLRDIDPDQVQRMDSVAGLADLRRVGRAAAASISRDHFAGFLADSTPPE
jgi:uncharacterized protein